MTPHDERGYTLIELLLSVMLMGVIVAAISGALVVMFTATAETTDRLSESPDLQIAAAYFGSDGQSATALNSQHCGPATATRAISFSWTDPGSDPATPTGDTGRKVSYVVEAVGTQKQLVRYSCVVPATGAESVDRTIVVNYLRPTTSPTAACSPSPCGATTTSIELPMTICTADASSACRNDPIDFSLRATRRAT